jgi:trans-aconitate methyltransferase
MLKNYAPHAQKILEIGCGTGFVLSEIRHSFPAADLSAGDIFTEGLHFAAERVSDCQFLQIDARQMPFANEFDVIGMFDVIEHITEDEVILEQLRQAIKPDGMIILTVPQHRFLWSYHDEQAQHKRRYEPNELENKARNVGLEVVRSTSFVSLLLPMMILQRRADTTAINKDEWHQHLLKVNPTVNRVAKILLSIEHFFIRLGFSFPMGGSRLVVLRRI